MDYLTTTTKKFNLAEINKRKAAPKIASSIDIHCEIQAVPFAALSEMKPGEPSEKIRERVIKARQVQEARFKDFKGIHCNAMMTERMLHEFAEPDAASLDMLRMAMDAGSEKVESMHIAEAIGYRNLDRGDWAERGI